MPSLTYVLDARTATGHFPGIGRYASGLSEAIDRTGFLIYNKKANSSKAIPGIQIG